MKKDDFLKKTLSAERWKTYEHLSKKTGLEPNELYERNIIYSKELYVILAGLEVVIRNTFHENLKKYFGKEDWMSDLGLFRSTHLKQLESCIKKVSAKNKKDYIVDDLISELNFAFWVHLLDSPYEQIFWTPALRRSFPHKFGKPVRQEIESRLKSVLKLRNKIAHLEPIIKQEKHLLQAYQIAYDTISWICPETANWFDNLSNFKNIWRDLNE